MFAFVVALVAIGLASVEGNSNPPATRYGYPISKSKFNFKFIETHPDSEDLKIRTSDSPSVYKIYSIPEANGNADYKQYVLFNENSKTFPIFEAENTTPSKEIVKPHQEYGVPTKPHKYPSKPHTQYGLPDKEKNTEKTFFPIFEVENTTPSGEIIIPHQTYGVPTKPHKYPSKPHTQYGVPHKDKNTEKTFFPIFEVEYTTPSGEIIIPHQTYGAPVTSPPQPHKEYGLPNQYPPKPHISYGVPHKKNNTPKTFLPVPHQVYGVPTTKPPKPHKEYGSPHNIPPKPHSNYGVPHKDNNTPKTFFPIFEIENTTPSEEIVIPHQVYGLPTTKPPKPHEEYGLPNKYPHKPYANKNHHQKQHRYALAYSDDETEKTFFPLDLNTQDIVEILVPDKELVVPHTEPPKPQVIHEVSPIFPQKPHEVYGVPPTSATKPQEVYGVPNKELKSNSVKSHDFSNHNVGPKKIPVLKFKYVPYVEYIDVTASRNFPNTDKSELDSDYW